MACCLMIVYKFYEMYYYNDVQDDVNAVVSKALHRASAMPWDTAAPILHAAMAQIMAGRLDDDNDNGDPEETTDRNAEISLEAALAEIQKIQQEAVAQAKAVQARTGLQSEAPANDGAGDNRSEENE